MLVEKVVLLTEPILDCDLRNKINSIMLRHLFFLKTSQIRSEKKFHYTNKICENLQKSCGQLNKKILNTHLIFIFIFFYLKRKFVLTEI